MTINKTNLAQVSFLLFLFSVFFPVRHVFLTSSAYILGQYSDFTSFSLYLSDILLITAFIIIFLPRGKSEKISILPNPYFILLLFWLILNLIWHFKTLSTLNLYYSLKYAELIVTCGTTYYLFSITSIKSAFFKLFGILSAVQAGIGLVQFATQRSIGSILHKLGEQVISRNIIGSANIVSGGTKYIRAYGTFPHPNALSAFLVIGVFVCLYEFLVGKSKNLKLFWALAIIINIFGLTATFSRAGSVALSIGLVIFFGYLLIKKPKSGILWSAVALILISLLCAFITFRPLLLTRETISDDASTQRITFAQTGLAMIKNYQIFGLGMGDSLLHMQQYSPIHLQPWEIQPIHNYFVLAAAELGIPGALILLMIFLTSLGGLIKKVRTESLDPQLFTFNFLLLTILAVFLVLMQFDHYFYTLQQTQMLLWIFLGIILAEIKKSPNRGLSNT